MKPTARGKRVFHYVYRVVQPTCKLMKDFGGGPLCGQSPADINRGSTAVRKDHSSRDAKTDHQDLARIRRYSLWHKYEYQIARQEIRPSRCLCGTGLHKAIPFFYGARKRFCHEEVSDGVDAAPSYLRIREPPTHCCKTYRNPAAAAACEQTLFLFRKGPRMGSQRARLPKGGGISTQGEKLFIVSIIPR